MKDRQQLLREKENLELALQAVETELAKYDETLHLYDAGRPFRKWSLAEQQQLQSISPAAYDWFIEDENQGKTIQDYNDSQKAIDFESLAG